MADAWRAYLEMALGLTEAPRKKAQKAAADLLSRGGATAAQLQGIVEDLLSASVANREALTNIVRYEVDRALGVVGLATAEEVSELTSRVRDLERELRAARAAASAGQAAQAGTGGTRLEQPAPVPRPAVKKVAKKAVAQPAKTTQPAKRGAAASKRAAAPESAVTKTNPRAAAVPRKVAPKAVDPGKTAASAPRKAAPRKAAPRKTTEA